MIKTLCFWTFALLFCFTVSGKTLWQADFSKPGMPGFKLERQNPNDKIETGNGELVATFSRCASNKGISYSQTIPMPDRGEFSFTAVLNDGSKPGYNGWSMQIILFGNLISWNGVHTIGMALYQNGYQKIYKNLNNRKVNYRIRYDVKAGTMDFYVDDSWLPVKRFTGIKFRRMGQGYGKLLISNYGFAHGKITHRLSNMKLTTWEDPVPPAEGKVIWQETFPRNTTMEDHGYKRTRDNKKDAITIKDGIVTFVCENSPGKGTVFEKKIPCPQRGEFTFEAKTNLNHSGGFTNCSMSLYLGEILMTFRQNYHMQLFHTIKLKWNTISGKISWDTWHKIKVVFDASSKSVEYYVDNMDEPVFIDEQSEFIPRKNVVLKIYNWGEASGSIVNQIRNLQMKELPPAETSAAKELSGTMLIRGVSSEDWELDTLLERLEDKGEVKSYLMNVHGPQLGVTTIKSSLDPKPVYRKILPKNIVIADAPASCMSQSVQAMVREAVNSGAKLILLGGLFSVERGCYQGTVLEELLPVSVKNIWQEVQPLDGAEVETLNGKNAVISKPFGKGKVFVVPGNVYQNPEITEIIRTFEFK